MAGFLVERLDRDGHLIGVEITTSQGIWHATGGRESTIRRGRLPDGNPPRNQRTLILDSDDDYPKDC